MPGNFITATDPIIYVVTAALIVALNTLQQRA